MSITEVRSSGMTYPAASESACCWSAALSPLPSSRAGFPNSSTARMSACSSGGSEESASVGFVAEPPMCAVTR